MSNVVYTFGVSEMQAKLIDLRRNFISGEDREQELNKLGTIAQREIVKETPVDTGKLRSSITVEVDNANKRAKIGTNVEYARSVEEGHVQHARFLPASDMSAKYGGPKTAGVMLSEKFVQGAHMFQKGMSAARPKLDAEINRWLSALAAKFNG
jgi:hypothetical protein